MDALNVSSRFTKTLSAESGLEFCLELIAPNQTHRMIAVPPSLDLLSRWRRDTQGHFKTNLLSFLVQASALTHYFFLTNGFLNGRLLFIQCYLSPRLKV